MRSSDRSWLLKILELFSPSTLTEEEKEALEGYQLLNNIENYRYYERRQNTEEKDKKEAIKDIKNFLNSKTIEKQDFINILLTSFSDKNAGELVLKTSSEKELNSIIEDMRDLELSVSVGSIKSEKDILFAKIYFSREMEENKIEQLENIEDANFYHMRAGKFFGYPDKDIKAFIKQNKNINELGGRIFPVKKEPLVLNPEKLFNEFGNDENSFYSDLIYFSVKNSKQGYERAKSIAISRTKDIETIEGQYDLDIL